MSGRKLVPFLEQTKDVYITGSPVARHKVLKRSAVAVPPGSSVGFATDPHFTTELVLSAKNLYKFRQPGAPPAPPQPAAAKPEKSIEAAAAATSQPAKQTASTQSLPKPTLVWRHSLRYVRCVVALANHSYHHQQQQSADGSVPINFYGFAVHVFTTQKGPNPKPEAQRTPYMRYVQHVACACVPDCFSLDGGVQQRIREYGVGIPRDGVLADESESGEILGSAYQQDDWCLSFKLALTNFWHEVLEDSVIPQPEIFQYQLFVMNLASSPHPRLAQIVLSTEKLYLIPRHTSQLLEIESVEKVGTSQMLLSHLEMVQINRVKGIVSIRGPSSSSAGGRCDLVVGCFEVREATELVLEIQRIWELTHKDSDFPFSEE